MTPPTDSLEAAPTPPFASAGEREAGGAPAVLRVLEAAVTRPSATALAAELARRLGSRLVPVRLAPYPVIAVPGPTAERGVDLRPTPERACDATPRRMRTSGSGAA